MANIFGEGFDPIIDKQVDIRQQKYGSGYASSRTPEELIYLNGNTSWCKLASATNLNQSGNELAKKYVLFNGTTPNGTPPQRAGVGSNAEELGAYGIGGTLHSGLAPMPGIISADIIHENRGSLRRAEVKIKAFNKEQFNIIDVLYLRLGYSILLEWGHSMYYQSNPSGEIEFVSSNPYSLTTEFLEGRGTYGTFLNLIQQYRLKSQGNYDAMFGRVANFSWSFLKDGTYDITLKLVSIGDVIESLKINTVTSPTQRLNNEESLDRNSDIIKQYASSNSLGAWLAYKSKTLIEDFEKITNLVQNGAAGIGTDAQGNVVLTSAATSQTGNVTGGGGGANDLSGNTGTGAALPFNIIPPGSTTQTTTSTGDVTVNAGTIDFVSTIYKSQAAQSSGSISSDVGDQYYVRLGALLNFLQSGANNISPIIPRIGNKNGSVPLIKFDLATDRVLMYTDKLQVATDPRICLIKKSVSTSVGDLSFNDDIGVCSDFDIPIGGTTYGRILNIYVNIVYIINTIKSNMDDQGKVDLYTFLKKILEGINLGLGGLNNLDIIIDETTNVVHIVDNNPLPNREQFFKNKKTTIFDLYGYKQNGASFVKDFNFQTEISNDLATMITVAAQYNGVIPGENPAALSRLNLGLTDRYKSIVTSKGSTSEYTFNAAEESKRFLESTNEYAEFLQKLSNKTVTIAEVEANVTKYKDILTVWDSLKNIDIIKAANPTTSTTSNTTFNNNSQVGFNANNQTVLSAATGGGAGSTPIPNTAGQTTTPTATTTIQSSDTTITNMGGFDLADIAASSKVFTSTSTNFTGFIPFNLQLTIDGLSGIKAIQKFLIDGEYLPRNYPKVVEFLIKGIQHQIVGSKWYTKLESYCISKGASGTSNAPIPTISNIVVESERVTTPFVSKISPFVFNYDNTLSPIRNKIVEIANSYYGQEEVPGRDNQAFLDSSFEQMMKSIGWFSSPASHWCNWFSDLVWREAYKAVGASDARIQNVFTTTLQSKVLPPLTAGVFRTLDAAVALRFGTKYSGGIFATNPRFTMPKPGDMIVYSSGHVNIVVKTNPGNRTFGTIGGNEGFNNNRNGAKVNYQPTYWSTEKIAGVVNVIE